MGTIDIIRAEIMRRQKIHHEEDGIFVAGQFTEDTDLLSFLDTIESEKPMQEDLKKEAVSYCFDNGINLSPRQAEDFARHFYELGLNGRNAK